MAEDIIAQIERELFGEDKKEEPEDVAPSLYCNNLMNAMNECRKKSSLCDVNLVVEDIEFPAHKIVLASGSEFFNGLFNAKMKENQQDKIVLKEVKASVMDNVLEYIYTGKTEVNIDNAYELIKISSYFLVDGLKEDASSYICSCLDLDNCLFIRNFAEEYSCRLLEEKCKEFIGRNFEEFIQEMVVGFYELEFEIVEELISNETTFVKKEESMFKTVKKWVMESPSTRKKHFKSLFQHIRLQHISKKYLNDVILKDELVTGNMSCMQFVLRSLSMMDSLPPLLRPRTSVDEHTDAIVVIGGFDKSNTPTRAVMCYAPSVEEDDAWRVLAPLSTPRYASTSAFCGSFLYSIGGWESGLEDEGPDYAVKTVERYDPTTNTWLNVEALPDDAEKWVAAAVLHGKIYVLCTSNKLLCYNPAQNCWDCIPSKPSNDSEIHGASLVAHSNNLYIIGGLDANNVVMSRLLRYDPEDLEWSVLHPMNVQRYLASAVVKGNNIYIMGGLKQYESYAMGEALGSCEVYSIDREVWEMIANLQHPRYAAGVTCIWDDIYVLGGEHEGETQSSVEHYDEVEKLWEVVSAMPCRSYFTCHWVRVPSSLQLEMITPESFDNE